MFIFLYAYLYIYVYMYAYTYMCIYMYIFDIHMPVICLGPSGGHAEELRNISFRSGLDSCSHALRRQATQETQYP